MKKAKTEGGEMETGGASRGCCESFADRVFAVTAMLGAAAGATGGALLGAETANLFPVLWGTLGTVIGSTIAAALGCLAVRLLSGEGGDHNPRAGQNVSAARALLSETRSEAQPALSPTTSAG